VDFYKLLYGEVQAFYPDLGGDIAGCLAMQHCDVLWLDAKMMNVFNGG